MKSVLLGLIANYLMVTVFPIAKRMVTAKSINAVMPNEAVVVSKAKIA